MASKLSGFSAIQLEIDLMDAGKRLLLLPPSCSELLDVLAHLEKILSEVQQLPSESMKYAMHPIIEALIGKELVRHPDMDVNILVASCICEILRIMAPNLPYNDQQMKDLFELAMMTFKKLSSACGGCFTRLTKVLKTFSNVKLLALMLDLQLDKLVVQLFKQFLTVADSNSSDVVLEMEKIMTMIIEKSEKPKIEIVGLLVKSVKKDNQIALPVCWKLGEKVLKNCSGKLKQHLPDIVRDTGIPLQDYSKMVAHICNGALQNEAFVPPKEEDCSFEAESLIDTSESRPIAPKRTFPTTITSCKKQRQGDGSPRPSSPPPPPPPPHPQQPDPFFGNLHPWLQFTDPMFQSRFSILVKKRWVPSRTFDNDYLKRLGIEERIKGLLKPKAWERMFRIKRPTYKELGWEFLSTFQLHQSTPPFTQKRAITFRLGGIERECSIADWAVRIGFYTRSETLQPSFATALCFFPPDFSQADYWKNIGTGIYYPSRQKTHQLHDPVMRIVHKAITHSIAPRSESSGVVSRRDLFYLYCLKEPEVECQLAYGLALYFAKYAGKGIPGGLCGGPFITRLAESYDILRPEVIKTLTRGPEMELWDKAQLFRSELLVKDDSGRYALAPWGGRSATDKSEVPPSRRSVRPPPPNVVAESPSTGEPSTSAHYASLGKQIRGLRSEFDAHRREVTAELHSITQTVTLIAAHLGVSPVTLPTPRATT